MSDFWKKCTFCKKEILFSSKVYSCSVSTCNQNATSYVFCTVQCWDGHVPIYRHRNAWAKEIFSPSKKQFEQTHSEPVNEGKANDVSVKDDVLIVTSKLKAFIRQSGMNTSDSVIDLLSKKVRGYCDQAIEKAKADRRQTVLDRDFINTNALPRQVKS